jgi:hypothetical protein
LGYDDHDLVLVDDDLPAFLTRLTERPETEPIG